MDFTGLAARFPTVLLVSAAINMRCFAGDVFYQLDPLVVTAEPRDSGYYIETTNTATRTLGDVLDTPFSVGIVSEPLLEDIEDSLSKRLEYTALFVSGVEQSSNQSGFDTDLIIRGFPTAARTYLDGVLDHPRYQVRDLALVDRVEILKGHSSVLWFWSISARGMTPIALKSQRISGRICSLTINGIVLIFALKWRTFRINAMLVPRSMTIPWCRVIAG